jgi:hypothetical protein
MTRFVRRFAASTLFLLLAFLAVPATAAEPSAAVRAFVGTPPPGKAFVVFYRPSKFVGAAVGFKVREDKKELGKLRNGKYFVATVEPGAHTYKVHSEAKDLLNLEVEAGETYFVSGAIGFGVMVGRPNISPSTAADFEKVMKKLKPAKPLEQDNDKDDEEVAQKDGAAPAGAATAEPAAEAAPAESDPAVSPEEPKADPPKEEAPPHLH